MKKDQFSFLKSKFSTLLPIDEACWIKLICHLQIQNYKQGEYLLRAGEIANHLYFIEKGLIRSYFIDHKGKEFIRAFMQEGDIAGPYAEMIQHQPSLIFLEALEDVTVLSIDFKILQKLYQENLWFSEIGRKIGEYYFISKEQRIFDFLHFDAAERYERLRKDNPDLFNRVPQYQIASFLGVTPVTLSRLIKKFKN